MGKVIDYTGQKIGYVTIIERISVSNKQGLHWRALCDCGNETITSSSVIRRQKYGFISCGCKFGARGKHNATHKDNPQLVTLNDYYHEYKEGARKRGIKWLLTKEDAFALFISNCQYCGTEPLSIRNIYTKLAKRRKQLPKFCEAESSKYVIKVNGIDRVASDGDYKQDNVVPCCHFCNRAKSDHPLDDFLNWIKRIKKQWQDV